MSDPKLTPVHDQPDRPPEPGMALCLSGGGYRAMIFHVGVLWRLNEAGLLGSLKRVSSVSGGSITAGVLALHWHELEFAPGKPSARFEDAVVRPLRKLASTTIDEYSIIEGILTPGMTISDYIAGNYDKHLFSDATLQDLPDDTDPARPAPRFVINSTNVQSGVLMRFSRPYMADYRVGRIDRPTLRLARAVAASSAFPPVLSPCEIDVADCGGEFVAQEGVDLSVPAYTEKLVLTDGGVYDNLGLETAFKRYDTIFASDAGGHFKPDPAPHHDWARHSMRVLDLVDSQVRALRSRQLMALFEQKERKGAYWSIRQDAAIYAGRSAALPCPIKRTTELALYPTRLAEMTDEIQERLINWGYAICDAALRTWLDAGLAQPAGFPYSRGV